MSATTLRPRSAPAAWPRVSNNTAVLVAALGTVAATAWAVMSAAWVDGTSAMLITAVAAVLEAVLVARSSVGRVIALLLLPVVGTLVVVPLTYGSMPGNDNITLGDAVRQYVDALTTGLFVQADWAFLVGLCGIFWLIGSWTGWVAVRERRGVLAVLPCYAVLAVNALNAPSLQNVAVPEAVAVVLSLVVVGRVHLLDLSARWRRTVVVALPGTERRFGRITLVASVVLLVAAVVVPPASNRDISGIFVRFNSGGGHHGGGGGGDGVGAGSAPGTIHFDPSTIPGGPLVSQPVPVLAYTTDSGQSLYLRVVNDSYFNEGNWYANSPVTTPGSDVTPTVVPANAGTIPRDRNLADGGVGPPSSLQPVNIKVVLSGDAPGEGQQLGIFPGEPDSISEDGSALGLVSGGGIGGLLTVDQFRMLNSTNTFTASATVSNASADQLRNAGTDYPSFVAAQYLSLNPTSTSDRDAIATLQRIVQQWTVGQSNPYDEASAIESHLRDTTSFQYTLKPPATRPGKWPIIDFLTRTHAGYCQYFASAMGALLRADGIPARLVSGYGPGAVDDSRSRAGSSLFQVSSSDAHVWVEAYFPHYGWVPFEPTPDGTYQQIPRGADKSQIGATPTSTPAPSTPTPTPKHNQPPLNNGIGGPTVPTIPPGLLGGVLSALFVFAVLVALRNWIAHPRSLAALWRRVGALGAVLGVRRRPSETVAAYVDRICRALPPDTTTLAHRDGSAELGPRPIRARTVAALEYLAVASGTSEFSAHGLSERETVQWRRAWDRVRRHVPLLLWRSLLARGARRGQIPQDA